MLIVHPGPARETTVEEAYGAPLGGHDGRPWIGLSMVASIDGTTVVDGTSGALSSDVDHRVMLQLRSLAQVVLVGAGTAAGEGYGPPSAEGLRIGVVTNSGSVDTTTELFTSGAGFVVTNESADVDGGSDGRVDVVRAGADEVDLRLAVERLADVVGDVGFVQVEGGPSLNGALADADLFDEMSITTSPVVAGGDGPRPFVGADDVARAFAVEQIAVADDFVFTRWRRRR